MENKYKNGKIYKIVDNGFNKMYVGSTTQELSQRFTDHRRNYHNYLLGKTNYVTVFSLFEEFGMENCQILLVELYPCECKIELRRKEGEHILSNKCVNKFVAGRTDKEYREQYPEKKKQADKNYYKNNTEKLKLRSATYYEQHKTECSEKQKVYRRLNTETIKQRNKEYYKQNFDKIKTVKKIYQIQNRDMITEWHKEYRERNKDRLDEYRKEKFDCACGGRYAYTHKSRHFASKKHLKWLDEQKNV